MALTAEQMKAREGRMTASAVGALMGDDKKKIYDLWRQFIGDPTYVPPNFDDIWPVALGSHTESLNLAWYEKKTGNALTRQGEVVVHPEHDWAAATLDGWDDIRKCCVETKHVGGFEPLGRIIERYTPQVHWQMIVTKSDHAILSIIEGAKEPVLETVYYDPQYASGLWKVARTFMDCVESLTPPVEGPAIALPVNATKIINMQGSNEWAHHAATWLEHRDAAKKVSAAEKALKSYVPSDAYKAHGYGVEITRDRANRMSLRAA